MYELSKYSYGAARMSTATCQVEKKLDQTAALCRCQKITPKAKRHFFIYCTKAWNGRTAEGEKTFLCNFSPPERVLLGHAADCRPTLAVCAHGRLLWALLESLAKHSTDCVRLENSSLTASLKAPIVRPPDSQQIYNLTRHYRSWSLMTWPSPTPTQECRCALCGYLHYYLVSGSGRLLQPTRWRLQNCERRRKKEQGATLGVHVRISPKGWPCCVS